MENRKTVIDLFVNGEHFNETYLTIPMSEHRVFDLVSSGWAVSASIIDEEENTLYISFYRPNGDTI